MQFLFANNKIFVQEELCSKSEKRERRNLLFSASIRHDTYIRGKLRICCAHMKEKMSFLWKILYLICDCSQYDQRTEIAPDVRTYF